MYFLAIILWISLISAVSAEGKLIFAIDIVRHGDRTPVIASPGMEKLGFQGLGQLTPRGMRQEYELGVLLRQTYVNKYHLLPSHYDINSMSVRSTGFPRTMMSAQSILYGLYPLNTGPLLEGKNALPQGFQPIPINSIPREQDSLLVPNHDKASYQKIVKHYLFNTPDWKQTELALKPNYSRWAKLLGMPITNLFDVIQVSDRLFVERLYNLSLPEGLDKSEADTIIDTGTKAMLSVMKHRQLALLAGGELAHTILQEITRATKKNRPLNYLLFVAHDSTLAAQLTLLGQDIDTVPGYAARINYALFDMGSNQYEVRVSYNQKPLRLKQCGGRVGCTLREFTRIYWDLLGGEKFNTVIFNGS